MCVPVGLRELTLSANPAITTKGWARLAVAVAHSSQLRVAASIEGAKARLRPILMTSLAFIFGLLPLALSSGVGAVGNRSIGMGAVGGMLVGTILGVFVIPILFIIFQSLQERISGKPFEEKEVEVPLLEEENEK